MILNFTVQMLERIAKILPVIGVMDFVTFRGARLNKDNLCQMNEKKLREPSLMCYAGQRSPGRPLCSGCTSSVAPTLY